MPHLHCFKTQHTFLYMICINHLQHWRETHLEMLIIKKSCLKHSPLLKAIPGIGLQVHALLIGTFRLQWTNTENAVEIMFAHNTRATAHAPRSQRTSTRPLPKSWTPNRPVSRCPQTVNAVHSSLWTKGAELEHDVIRLRSLVDVQSKTRYWWIWMNFHQSFQKVQHSHSQTSEKNMYQNLLTITLKGRLRFSIEQSLAGAMCKSMVKLCPPPPPDTFGGLQISHHWWFQTFSNSQAFKNHNKTS